ncbi:MAG: ATP-dependent DNA helicase, partial [Clostridia bacterium]|nr:ATP-dependent DNA helicase [Clostridia bacterium]
ELEEERRLMYVAMTRAKERLILSYVNTRYLHGRRTPMLPSRFIDEAGINIPTKPKVFSEDAGYSNYEYRKSVNNFNTIKQQTQTTTFNNGYTRASGIDDNKPKKDTSKFNAGQTVKHPKFGKGVIHAIVDDGVCAEIIFDDFGKKTLILEIAPLEIL